MHLVPAIRHGTRAHVSEKNDWERSKWVKKVRQYRSVSRGRELISTVPLTHCRGSQGSAVSPCGPTGWLPVIGPDPVADMVTGVRPRTSVELVESCQVYLCRLARGWLSFGTAPLRGPEGSAGPTWGSSPSRVIVSAQRCMVLHRSRTVFGGRPGAPEGGAPKGSQVVCDWCRPCTQSIPVHGAALKLGRGRGLFGPVKLPAGWGSPDVRLPAGGALAPPLALGGYLAGPWRVGFAPLTHSA